MLPLTSSPFNKETEQRTENTQNNEKQVKHGGYSYSISKNELPKSEEIVKQILEQEKNEYQKEILGFEEILKKEDSEWQNKERFYLKNEEWIRENSDKIPLWQVTGPLNYGMSLEQMQDVITNKFKEMAFSGNLMTEEQLKNYDRETFYPTTQRGGDNLTRIWGAEFLKSNLIDSKTLNAAEHFLIVDDFASEIEVQVGLNEYPILYFVRNAHVLSQKIEGDEASSKYSCSGKLAKLGYKDYQDPGNIICDSKGTGWVVDTEWKSFDKPELDRTSEQFQEYLKKRFEVLSGVKTSFLTFKISVADLT